MDNAEKLIEQAENLLYRLETSPKRHTREAQFDRVWQKALNRIDRRYTKYYQLIDSM